MTLLPTVSTLGLLCFVPYLLETPLRIAFTILANLMVFGSGGYLLGRFKAYSYAARTFLTLLIAGLLLGFAGGILGGIAYGLYHVVRLIIYLAFGTITVAIIVFIIASKSKEEDQV